MKKYSLQRGAGILEVLLMLGIAAVIVVFAMQQYGYRKATRDIAVIKNSVAYLMQATNQYIAVEYIEPNKITDIPLDTDLFNSIKLLLPVKLLNVVVNPLNNSLSQPYQIYVTKIESKDKNNKVIEVYQYTIRSEFTSSDVATFVAAMTNGSGVQGNSVTWSWLPAMQAKNMDSNFWVMNPQLQALKNVINGTNNNL